MNDPLEIIQQIGTPVELRSRAAERRPTMAPDNNAHLHLPPNFSAFRTVAEAMELADEQNCRIVGASNYYDFETYRDFSREARHRNVFPLFGIEIICMLEDLRAGGVRINDPVNPGKMYICGKGLTHWAAMPAEARRILDEICSADAKRTGKLVDRVSQVLLERGLANDIDAEKVIDLVVCRHNVPRGTVFLQERHVALAFQEHFFAITPPVERVAVLSRLFGAAPKIKSSEDAVGVQNELRSHLMKAGRPAYVEETFIDFVPAMRLISLLGGFASYPILGDSTDPLCPFEASPEKLAESLLERGIYAAEFLSVRNRPEFMLRYARVLRRAGIILTAGTEHNLLEMIPIAPTALGGARLPEELREMFYEGACVIAAHQFLGTHRAEGYAGKGTTVGREGMIRSLASLGHTVIERFIEARVL